MTTRVARTETFARVTQQRRSTDASIETGDVFTVVHLQITVSAVPAECARAHETVR